MSVSAEERRIRNLFERVETIEEVAITLPEGDDRFPIKRGNTLAAADEEPVQFFEHGVVTVRKGKLEAWLRPDDTSSGI
jgi:hypothetical protein